MSFHYVNGLVSFHYVVIEFITVATYERSNHIERVIVEAVGLGSSPLIIWS